MVTLTQQTTELEGADHPRHQGEEWEDSEGVEVPPVLHQWEGDEEGKHPEVM